MSLKKLAIFAAVFAATAAANGQTPTVGATAPAAKPTYVNLAELTWSAVPSEPGYLILHDWKIALGKLDPVTGVWHPSSGEPVDLREKLPNGHKPTGALPAPAAVEPKSAVIGQSPPAAVTPRDNGPPATFPGGVDVSKLRSDSDRYTIGERTASRAEVMSALQTANEIPDDSRAVRMTLIGCVTCREQVIKDLDTRPELAPYKGKLVVQSYPNGHWRVKDGAFQEPAANNVMIYVQDAGGAVLWRQEGYDGGAPALAKALRDRCPNYDPAKDPGPNTPATQTVWWLIGGAAIAGAVIYAKKKGK